jgi:hypothetical protein
LRRHGAGALPAQGTALRARAGLSKRTRLRLLALSGPLVARATDFLALGSALTSWGSPQRTIFAAA